MTRRAWWLVVPAAIWAALLTGLLLAASATVALAAPPARFVALQAVVGLCVARAWPWYPRGRGWREALALLVAAGAAWLSWFAGMVVLFLFGSGGGEI